MRTLLDVDGVIADLVGAVCHELRLYGYKRTAEDIKTYDFAKSLFAQEADLIWGAMSRPGFCAELPWYEGAKEFVSELSSLSEVVAVTKPYHGSPTWGHERTVWLQPHVPKVVLTGHKEVCMGDVLVEDSPENALGWLAQHPGKRVVLLDRPWNRVPFTTSNHNLVRAHSYEDALREIGRTVS